MNIIKNRVQLIGIIDTPLLEILGDGTKCAIFRISSRERFISATGEKITEQMYHQCKAFGKQALVIEKYCISGMEVGIEGVLINSISKYKGIVITSTVVHVREFIILSQRD